MTLLTTVQVRNVMKKNGLDKHGLFTNKHAKAGCARTVKCYYNGNAEALAALKAACGAENVTLTRDCSWGEGIIVKCVIAE